MKSMFSIIGLVVSMVFAGSHLMAAQVEAKKDNVKIYAKASKKAKVIQKLKKGETIESKERKGMYWQVVVGNKTGYVSVMKVKRLKASSNLTSAIRDAVKQGRDEADASNARQRSTVMGVRGLDENDDVKFAGNAKPNIRLVHKMEDILVPNSEVDDLGELVFQEIETKLEN